MEKRKVQVFKYEIVSGQRKFGKVLEGIGVFHAWGVDYEEFESGPGNFSTALVEMPDGSIKNVPVELIQFDD